ncbi:MAG: lysophospholipase [Symploca sp. SIO3C6]|uniref:Lysophospholipase n=1 Tax=Symploca sp. SIO1C4 TaxID=2607765 RepID=A0A6B3N7K7_9CYAN|nr:lysophospholipase [Symploca sp. SIO3C6]NER27580.1 lysophospholipase [Symploca sp. SIO1C4]NET06895.1 lysophospholipase [Symploca sp. SIO2B6]NET51170.1 lysophospholipase [Merismopedia sp. SIO2A8]
MRSVRVVLKSCPSWAIFSLAANGLLTLAFTGLLLRQHSSQMPLNVQPTAVINELSYPLPELTSEQTPELGPRHHLNYRQWVSLLSREAQAVASQNPENLTILLGDSLSLWFPSQILPSELNFLNQGISGETSAGLLRRLELLDQTQPSAIFVMVGINDLIRGVKSETILANQRLIIRYLRRVHPQATIILQSILPHSEASVTWEGRERLLSIPNSRIRKINQRSQKIAQTEGAIYLDLYPLFADANGALLTELTTDGLHLSPEGYLIWRNAIRVTYQVVVGK